MRNKSSSSSSEQPQLSGAYIRSLVKQLSSSRLKEQPSSATSPDSVIIEQVQPPPPLIIQPPQPPHRKQVRRRLHTTRPYQERLLNMAEARREIVTALKCHRAAMKQRQQPPPKPVYNYYDSFNFLLPNQPLGLNLNLQGFDNVEEVVAGPTPAAVVAEVVAPEVVNRQSCHLRVVE